MTHLSPSSQLINIFCFIRVCPRFVEREKMDKEIAFLFSFSSQHTPTHPLTHSPYHITITAAYREQHNDRGPGKPQSPLLFFIYRYLCSQREGPNCNSSPDTGSRGCSSSSSTSSWLKSSSFHFARGFKIYSRQIIVIFGPIS